MDLAPQLAQHPRFEWRRGMFSVWAQLPEHGGHRTVFEASNGAPHHDPWFRPDAGRWTCQGPDLADPATAGVLLGMLVDSRGGLFGRAMESIEECDPEADADGNGRSFDALIDAYGLGLMCARALLATWGS